MSWVIGSSFDGTNQVGEIICGRLGKTTLANVVYRKIREHFYCQAFVSVSQKPNIKNCFTDLISQVSSHGFTEDTDNWDEKDTLTN